MVSLMLIERNINLHITAAWLNYTWCKMGNGDTEAFLCECRALLLADVRCTVTCREPRPDAFLVAVLFLEHIPLAVNLMCFSNNINTGM